MTQYDTIENSQELSEHQKHVLTDALQNLTPQLNSGNNSYIRNVKRSGTGTICLSVEEISTAQFEHMDLDHIPGLQFVQTADGELTICFEDHGVSYKIFMYEQRDEESDES